MCAYLKHFVSLLVLCGCIVRLDAQELQPSYTVVAPKIVRPNSDFLVAVSVYNIANQEGKIGCDYQKERNT